MGDIAANRRIELADVQSYADDLGAKLAATQGDMARAALEAHLVDELLTSDQANVRVAEQVGFSDDSRVELNAIDFESYLLARNLRDANLGLARNKVAVIVAQGVIVSSGSDDSVVSADTTIELIRRARQDPTVKAVVLRVDSPGGSQLASELDRSHTSRS